MLIVESKVDISTFIFHLKTLVTQHRSFHVTIFLQHQLKRDLAQKCAVLTVSRRNGVKHTLYTFHLWIFYEKEGDWLLGPSEYKML